MLFPGRAIKKGERDLNIVRAVQAKLVEKGIQVVIDGDFGEKTHSAVKLFQARNFDLNGRPLIIDGVIGIITWDVLFDVASNPPVISGGTLAKKVIQIAKSQIGILESPLNSNSGPEVNKYLASVGLGPGYAWCMAFVYYCFKEASNDLSMANPLVKTGGCLNQWNQTTLPKLIRSQAVATPSKINPGSVFIMDFGGGLGHTGIVESVSNGFITSIEGNTNNDHSRNGIGVYSNTRKINSISKGFIIV
jgi:peptidoglycan hydrolase-like protein with peptidoglycan-binding domain